MEAILAGTDMVELGRAIRCIRKAAGMTTDELAQAAGSLTRPSLTRIELGKAQSASFDSVYCVLKVIGELPMIRGNDFDLRPYSKEIQDLIRFFARHDNGHIVPKYKHVVSKQIDEACDGWSKEELDGLLMQVQCRNGMLAIRGRVNNLQQVLSNNGLTVGEIDEKELFSYIADETFFIHNYRHFLATFNQGGKYTEIFDLLSELLQRTEDYVVLLECRE